MDLPTLMRATRENGRTLVEVTIKSDDSFSAAIALPGYLSRLKIQTSDSCVAEIISGARAAKQPLFKFEIEELEPGAELALAWIDNRGYYGSAITAVA